MRGLYRRGKIFWYSKMVDGWRTQISLSTEDQNAAVANVVAMRRQQELLPVNTYEGRRIGREDDSHTPNKINPHDVRQWYPFAASRLENCNERTLQVHCCAVPDVR